MKIGLLRKEALYVLDERASICIHRAVIRIADIGVRGVVTWEDPVNGRRGYINSRHIVSECRPPSNLY